MIEPHAVLQVADGVLDLGVAAVQVAIRPRRCPGQMRMPVPNGMYAS